MAWAVDPVSDVPPSRQLVEAVLDAVAAGEIAVGDPLPSVRKLAAEALVNHNTVARAYRDLEHLGITAGRAGLGVFVTQGGPEIARGERREATLRAFERALFEALRAGHDPAALERLLVRARERKSA